MRGPNRANDGTLKGSSDQSLFIFEFNVERSRIRLFSTLNSKIKWLWSGLPLNLGRIDGLRIPDNFTSFILRPRLWSSSNLGRIPLNQISAWGKIEFNNSITSKISSAHCRIGVLSRRVEALFVPTWRITDRIRDSQGSNSCKRWSYNFLRFQIQILIRPRPWNH